MAGHHAEVECRLRCFDRVEIVVEGPPIPSRSSKEGLGRNGLDFGQHAEHVPVVMLAEGRDGEATVATDHRGHPMEGGG